MKHLVVLAMLLLLCGAAAATGKEETFTEELLLRPLPDGKVLAHFHLVSEVPSSYGSHHRIFPKAIFQLVGKMGIREMELSFSQGRWDYERWGAHHPLPQMGAAKPVGVQLSASFQEGLVGSAWTNLTHALSGLFCASLDLLSSPTTYLDQRDGTRTGTLPREAVCTENLTPWLKLLPCRDKAGLAQLLDRPTIYSGSYHSLRLAIRRHASGSITLEQSLTLVLRRQASLFNLPGWTPCPLATLSKVYLEHNATLLDYQLGDDLDLGSYTASPSTGPFQVTRFLTGSGNAKGAMAMLLRAHHGRPCAAREVTIRQMVPWYVRLYGHTLQASVDGHMLQASDVSVTFIPAEDRKSAASLEISLRLAANVSTVAISIEYDKGFLRVSEHPPDASRGFDLPSALVSFPGCHVQRQYPSEKTPLVDALQREYPLNVYSEALLMPLAVPDFSMPYNVILFTSTILAMSYGALLNGLLRRVGEEGQTKGSGAPRKWFRSDTHFKLFKFVLVGAVAAGAHYYYSS